MPFELFLRRSSLVVAVLSLCAACAFAAGAQAAAPIGAYTTKGAWSFLSAPNLHPPKLRTDVKTVTKPLPPGYFRVDNFPNVTTPGPMTGEGGPLILNDQLQPVWSYPVGTGVTSTNLKQQVFDGKPVLSWWQGVVTNSGVTTSGEIDVVNQDYRKVAT